MITEAQKQALRHEAATGRGLWIGLFPEEYPNDTVNKIKHPLREWWPGDAHVTLTHLGKGQQNVSAIDTIARATTKAKHRFGKPTVTGEITGVGMFWRRVPTLVALVNSADTIYLRELLLNELRLEGIRVETRFGFIPHITLSPQGTIFDLLNTTVTHDSSKKLSDAAAFTTNFPELTIVCGDVRVTV